MVSRRSFKLAYHLKPACTSVNRFGINPHPAQARWWFARRSCRLTPAGQSLALQTRPAIHRDFGAGHVARAIGGKEGYYLSHFTGLSHALERDGAGVDRLGFV